MTRQPSKHRGKVVLAADAGSYSVTSVSLAVAMAASAGSLLQGLFVEDEDLLQITGLPCAREITLTTATERGTSREQMQRSLRLVAHQFEQTLRQQAQALQVAWSFATMRGRVRDIGLQPASDVAYTILANSSTHRLQSARPQVARRILLMGDTSKTLERALKMLIERYGHEDVELTLLADGQGDGKKPGEGRWMRQYGQRITLVGLPLQELLTRLGERRAAFDFAILAGHDRSEDKALLVKALHCPIILIA